MDYELTVEEVTEQAWSSVAATHQGPHTALRQRESCTTQPPPYKYTNLSDAVLHGDIDEIRRRVQSGGELTRSWRSLVHSVAITDEPHRYAKRLDIAKMFIAHGADIDTTEGWNGETPLMVAMHSGNSK